MNWQDGLERGRAPARCVGKWSPAVGGLENRLCPPTRGEALKTPRPGCGEVGDCGHQLGVRGSVTTSVGGADPGGQEESREHSGTRHLGRRLLYPVRGPGVGMRFR